MNIAAFWLPRHPEDCKQDVVSIAGLLVAFTDCILAVQKGEGGGDAKGRLINAVGPKHGGTGEEAAEAPCLSAVPDCHSQDQFFEELLRLPPPVGRCRCPQIYMAPQTHWPRMMSPQLDLPFILSEVRHCLSAGQFDFAV